MKTLSVTIAVALLIVGLSGVVWLRQRQKEQATQQEAAALQAEVQALQSELASSRPREEPTGASPRQATPQVTAPPRAGSAPVMPVASNAAAPSPAMLNDPETRALLRKQQQQALGKSVDKFINANFTRQLNLSPEQAGRVKDWVRAKASAAADFSTAMLFDGLEDNALAVRGRETKQKIDEADAALRELLGAEGFNALRERERAMPEEDGVKKFREELASTTEPLSEEQGKLLLAAMSSERQAFSFRINYDDPATYDFEHIRDYFSEANLQTYFEDLLQVNARIAERAALFLSPSQLEQLKTAQRTHLDQARLTVKMTTELFNKRRAN